MRTFFSQLRVLFIMDINCSWTSISYFPLITILIAFSIFLAKTQLFSIFYLSWYQITNTSRSIVNNYIWQMLIYLFSIFKSFASQWFAAFINHNLRKKRQKYPLSYVYRHSSFRAPWVYEDQVHLDFPLPRICAGQRRELQKNKNENCVLLTLIGPHDFVQKIV